MSAHIKDEIARRLGSKTEDVEPVLETVVQRIRQQVEHYGYARISSLGTFRGRDERIVFEADPGLEEIINARFAGLEPLILKRASGEEDAVETDRAVPIHEGGFEREPDTGFDGTEDPERAADVDFGGTAAPDRKADVDLEGTDVPERSPDEDVEGTEAPKVPIDTEPEGTEAPETYADAGFEGTETPAEPSAAEFSGAEEPHHPIEEPFGGTEEPEDETEEEQAYWDAFDRPKGEHPLGPETEPPYEEADYSVIGEREPLDEESDAASPTVTWAPLGASAEAGDQGEADEDVGDPSDAGEIEDPAADEVPVAGEEAPHAGEQKETESRHGPPTAPDRPAYPHGMRTDGPVRTMKPPAQRRARQGPDPKAIWFGVGVLVFVAVAAIAYFVLPDRPAEPRPQQTAATEEPVLPDTAAAIPQAADTAAAEVAEPTVSASSPLRSAEGVDPSRGGYTIVVSSDTNRGRTEDAAQEYRDAGFRTGIISSQDDGVTRYRVAIGQFETLEEATQMRDELAGTELPGDAWVLRL